MISFKRTSSKQALGVMLDGRDLRIAHMGRERGEIVIHGLESVTLQHRLGKIRSVKSPAAAGHETDNKDVFGLEDQVMTTDGDNEDENAEGDVSSTLINVFSKYPLNKLGLAVNVPEGQTTYYSFENDFQLKGAKLHKRLREEIGPLAGGSVESSLLDHFSAASGELTAVVFEGSVPLIEELLEIKSFLPGGAPYFACVQANELALVNLARATLNLEDGKIAALVYLGADFSRVIILKGDYPLSFVQTIREGYTSPQVCQTLFSKILLEQEEAGLPEIERIILAGEVGLTHAHDFFSKQFPDARVQSFTPGPLNVGALKAEEIAVFPNYAVPVALAWQALEGKSPYFIRADLLPGAIKEQQKVFKVAWHGFALLGFVFGCMALLSYQGLNRRSEIRMLQESIRYKQDANEALQPELAIISQLQAQIGNYRTNLDFLDSLIVDPGKWSRLFEKLSKDFHDVHNIWIEDIKSDPQGFSMVGKALSRDRIPKLAFGFNGSGLKRVTRVRTDEGELTYEFELTANVPAPKINNNLVDSLAGADKAASASVALDSSATSSKAVIEAPSDQPPAAPVAVKPSEPAAAKTEPQAAQPKTEPPAAAQPQPAAAQAQPAQTEPQPTMSVDEGGEPYPPMAAAINPAPPKEPAPKPDKPEPKPQLASAKPAEAAPATDKPAPAPEKSKPEPARSGADHGSYSVFYNKGIKLVRAGDPDGAVKAFDTALAQDSKGPEAAASHYWIGECHFASHDYSTAVEDFQASLDLADNPKREAAILMLGLTHLKLKQYGPAKAQFDQLLEEFPQGEFASSARNYLKSVPNSGK